MPGRLQITKVHGWIGGAEKAAEVVRNLIEYGTQFFTAGNIRRLSSIGIEAADLEAAISEIRRLMAVPGKRLPEI